MLLALDTLRTNKLRSALTILGVVIVLFVWNRFPVEVVAVEKVWSALKPVSHRITSSSSPFCPLSGPLKPPRSVRH